MKRNRFRRSHYPGSRLLSRLWSTFSQRPLWQLGLFITTLATVTLAHLGVLHLPAIAAPNNNLALINAFVPENAPPGVPVTYRLIFRNNTGAPVGITSLSNTLPSTPDAPGNVIFTATEPTLNTCGSIFTINDPGSNPGTPGAYTITGGTIPMGDPGQCFIEIPVTGFEGGNHIDIIPAGALFTDAGESPDETRATLQVDDSQDITVGKSFAPKTIPGGGRALVTITLTNNNDYDLTGATLADILPDTPAQMEVDTRALDQVQTTCGVNGDVHVNPDGFGVTLTNGTIPADGDCTMTFPVTQATGGTYKNTIPANTLSTVNQITNGNTIDANLNIQTEVTITKDMAARNLDEGESTDLTITIANGGVALTNAGLTDVLPAPLVIADDPQASTNCTVSGNFESAPLTAVAESNSVSLSGGQVPASDPDTNSLGTCEIRVRITLDPDTQTSIGGFQDTLTNVIPEGSLTNDQGQTAKEASDSLRARVGLQARKSYSNNNTIAPGATTQMEIRIQNRSGAEDATGVSFTDAFPSPLEVATPLDVTYNNNCGGGSFTGVAAGDTTLNFENGTIPAGKTCLIRVDVYVPPGTSIGTELNNIIDNDSIDNDQGFDTDGVTNEEGKLQVVSRVVITKAFVENTIRRGTTSTVVIRIENNRRDSVTNQPEPLTGVEIADDLPDNLQVSDPDNLSALGCDYDNNTPVFTDNTPAANPFGAGSTSFKMTGAALAPISDSNAETDTCEIRFDVEEIDRDFFSPGNATPRTYNNATSEFTNLEGEGIGTVATADLTVISPLDGDKFFQSAQILAGGRSAAVIQLNNSLPDPLTVVSFTDSWGQDNTVVADPPNTSTTCGGTVSATPGSQSATLTGGTVPAQTGGVFGLCEIRFDVAMNAEDADVFTNTVGANTITTNEGFTNPTDISGDLTRTTSNLAVNKVFVPKDLVVGDPSTLTVTVTNPSNGIPVTEFGFTDTMPAEMLVFSTPNAMTTCAGGSVSANPGETSFTLSGATLGSDETCEVTLQITLIDSGNSINTIPGGALESKENVTNSTEASTTVNALAALKPEKAFNPTAVDGGVPSLLTLTIENLQTNLSNAPLQNVSITDNLPNDLFVSNTPNASTNCTGGIINVTPGGTVVAMTGATLAPQASCEIFVDVVSSLQGSYVNQVDQGDVTAELPLGGIVSNTSRPKATLNVNNDALPPELLLVKRITAVNGVPITDIEDSDGPDDEDPHWPAGLLQGAVNYTIPVAPGDELEYTIYYLNTGLGDATDVLMCDRVPAYTSFVARGYMDESSPAPASGGLDGADLGIILAEAGNEVSLTNANDGDTGYYFGPGDEIQATFPELSCNGDSSNGTVVVGVPNAVLPASGPGTPAASYGYMRFKAKVN